MISIKDENNDIILHGLNEKIAIKTEFPFQESFEHQISKVLKRPLRFDSNLKLRILSTIYYATIIFYDHENQINQTIIKKLFDILDEDFPIVIINDIEMLKSMDVKETKYKFTEIEDKTMIIVKQKANGDSILQ